MSNLLEAGIEQLGLETDQELVDKLDDFLDLLQKWNRVYNLTAIRDRHQMVIHHLLDSLALQPYLTDQDLMVVDLGTGAGLPGIPLALLNPEKQFVLVDSNGKKTRFVTQACIELGLKNCRVQQARAENLSLKQVAQVVLSRAFTSLQSFAEMGTPLLAPGGRLLAMKGKYPQDEVEELSEKFKIVSALEITVPFLQEERHLIEIKQAD